MFAASAVAAIKPSAVAIALPAVRAAAMTSA
jgi:hypothetical protein